ncbi:hypothetical protein [Williamsia maris]|uniref:FUSC family protein n=1 Tax=Williamsia maris TaxID=72806 RepID=A0ABT1HEV1_9NOCA|nr:hypothetical protein [Williamsia maris]MCP2176770.1 hypothetical protein [Williamsia maris]
MAREPDADSRPISVAELMARARELDDASTDGDAGSDGSGSDGSGRRRRGGAGSVSFAELTGELPRVSDAPSRSGRQAAEQESNEPAATSAPSADPGSRFVPTESSARVAEPTRGPFPRSEPPRPTREPGVFPRSEAPAARPFEPPTRPAAWASPDRGAGDRPVHPPTRDISSGAIADRFRDQRRAVAADAVETGIIPRVEQAPEVDASAPPTGSLDGADLGHLTPQEREREFERYRNFEDIDDLAETEPEPKKKRGRLGGLLRGRSATAADLPIDDAPADPADDHEQWDDRPWTRWPADDAADTDAADTDAAETDEVRDHLRDSGDFDFADDSTTAFGAGESFPRDDAAPRPAPPVDGRRRRDADAETQIVDLDQAQVGAYADERDAQDHPAATAAPEQPRRRRARTDDADTTSTEHDTEASPARQWAMLGIQVVVGLVVGVGLFLGFHELWKWNVYFALVLAVVVMFGMVTTVHVVRRSQDLISTLLALGVGLIVTIGPLVLLASGS